MMNLVFSLDEGKKHKGLVALDVTIIEGSQIFCSAVSCADSRVTPLNFFHEIAQFRQLFISYHQESTQAESNCINTAVSALQDSMLATDGEGIFGELRGVGTKQITKIADHVPNSPAPSGIRLTLNGNEVLAIGNLTDFSYARVTIALRESNANLFVIAQGIERGINPKQVCWYRQEIAGEAMLFLEIPPI